ncbi:MAG: hypothetical protein V4505_01130 [Pseudomonadota bacterium]
MATSKVMGLVSPDEWRKRTSLTFSSRGTDTKTVDTAYDAYFRSHGEADGEKLFLALEEYLKSHGSNWDKAARDKASGGLMRYIHESVKKFAKPGLQRNPSDLDRARGQLAAYDIPHSRYGVLYLLGNTDIEYDTFGIVMEGIGDVGGAFGHAFGDGHKLPVLGLPVKSDHYITAGSKIIKKAPKVISALSGPSAHKNTSGEEVASVSVDTRIARVQVADQGWPRTNKAINTHYDSRTYGTLAVAGSAIADAFAMLKVKLTNLVYSLVDWIRSKIATNAVDIAKISGTVLRKIVNIVVGKILAQAVPVLDVISDLSGGIMKTFDAAKVSIGAWMERRKISLTPGHPELTASTLESAMRMGIGAGLVDLLKGAAKAALHSFLPGLSLLISAIMTGIEFIVKFIMRMCENEKIKAFLKVAKEHFGKEEGLARAKQGTDVRRRYEQLQPELDPAKGGIITDLTRFKEFFQQGCDASPLIPMLTLNSGICGSLMVMLAMFKDTRESEMISQKTWDTGAAYFTRLKEFGRTYIRASGFEFTSTDHFVRQTLLHAKTHHATIPTTFDKGRAFVGGLLGA